MAEFVHPPKIQKNTLHDVLPKQVSRPQCFGQLWKRVIKRCIFPSCHRYRFVPSITKSTKDRGKGAEKHCGEQIFWVCGAAIIKKGGFKTVLGLLDWDSWKAAPTSLLPAPQSPHLGHLGQRLCCLRQRPTRKFYQIQKGNYRTLIARETLADIYHFATIIN